MGTDNKHWIQKRSKLSRDSKLKKEYKGSILIVCEGEKTEPNYFESFQTSGVKINVIGRGKNTVSLIKDAIEIWKEYAKDNKFYETLWCVFDRDSFPQDQYNLSFEMIESAQAKLNSRHRKSVGREISINIAYSNEAFELWYLLHYDFHNVAISRKQYIQILNRKLNIKYKKNDPCIYYRLKQLSDSTMGKKGQDFAIKNAQRLIDNSPKTINIHNTNPSTTVHLLVKELNKHLK